MVKLVYGIILCVFVVSMSAPTSMVNAQQPLDPQTQQLCWMGETPEQTALINEQKILQVALFLVDEEYRLGVVDRLSELQDAILPDCGHYVRELYSAQGIAATIQFMENLDMEGDNYNYLRRDLIVLHYMNGEESAAIQAAGAAEMFGWDGFTREIRNPNLIFARWAISFDPNFVLGLSQTWATLQEHRFALTTIYFAQAALGNWEAAQSSYLEYLSIGGRYDREIWEAIWEGLGEWEPLLEAITTDIHSLPHEDMIAESDLMFRRASVYELWGDDTAARNDRVTACHHYLFVGSSWEIMRVAHDCVGYVSQEQLEWHVNDATSHHLHSGEQIARDYLIYALEVGGEDVGDALQYAQEFTEVPLQ